MLRSRLGAEPQRRGPQHRCGIIPDRAEVRGEGTRWAYKSCLWGIRRVDPFGRNPNNVCAPDERPGVQGLRPGRADPEARPLESLEVRLLGDLVRQLINKVIGLGPGLVARGHVLHLLKKSTPDIGICEVVGIIGLMEEMVGVEPTACRFVAGCSVH